MIMLTLTFIPLVLMVAYLFNTGEQLARKQKLQNAADAAAVAQASYAARSMNVISMNNVAVSQALAMDVVLATLVPAVAEMDIESYSVNVTDITAVNAACDGPQILIVAPCVYAAAREIAALFVDFRLVQLNVAMYTSLPKLHGHVQAYSQMSDHLVSQFPSLSQSMQSSLGSANGISTDTRLIMIGSTAATDQDPNYQSTGLPVIRVDAWYGITHPGDLSLDYGAGVARQQLYNGGLNGTQTGVVSQVPAWNYRSHGYPSGKGPYPLVRDNMFDRFVTIVDIAKFAGWAVSLNPSKSDSDDCWRSAAAMIIAPWGCKNGVPADIPVGTGMYALRSALAPSPSPGIVDFVALTRAQRDGGPVAVPHFKAVPGEMYGIARARLYNVVAADLYTQDWRATLIPVQPNGPTLLQLGSGDLQSGTASAIATLNAQFPRLQNSLTGLSDDDLHALQTH
jgi:hypothetical protein